MDDAGVSSGTCGGFVTAVAFAGGLLSIVVGTAQILGATQQLQAVGWYILLGLGIVALFAASYSGYQRLFRASFVNYQRVRHVRTTLDRFIGDRDDTVVNARVDIGEIHLIERCMKARGLRPKVRGAEPMDPAPGSTEPRIRLLVDKGTEHGLVAGMKFAVYRAGAARQLCVVTTRHPGQSPASARNMATLQSGTTRIVVTVNDMWGIVPNGVQASEFEVRLIQPVARSDISQLLARLAHEVDREWGLRDLRQ